VLLDSPSVDTGCIGWRFGEHLSGSVHIITVKSGTQCSFSPTFLVRSSPLATGEYVLHTIHAHRHTRINTHKNAGTHLQFAATALCLTRHGCVHSRRGEGAPLQETKREVRRTTAPPPPQKKRFYASFEDDHIITEGQKTQNTPVLLNASTIRRSHFSQTIPHPPQTTRSTNIGFTTLLPAGQDIRNTSRVCKKKKRNSHCPTATNLQKRPVHVSSHHQVKKKYRMPSNVPHLHWGYS
jgi:hypothetical protein